MRTHRRALLTTFVALLATSVVTVPAQAHDTGGTGGDHAATGTGDQPDAEAAARAAQRHAEEDLVGVPVSEVEAATAARAAGLGLRPTTRRQALAETQETTASTDPAVVGRWSAVQSTPVVPVFDAVLPNGKVLMWDSVGDNGVDTYPDHTFTRAAVWDPVTSTSRRVDVQGYNIFCAGFVQLSDGDVLVVGGNKDAEQAGIRQTHLFDWTTETWSRGPDMAGERWYPSVAALANGEALVVAGGPATAEVHQTDGAFRPLIGFDSFSYREYPFLVPRSDAGVEVVGPAPSLERYDTAGSGRRTATATRDGIYRNVGSFATYAVDRTLVAGGGQEDVTFVPRPQRTAVVVDTRVAGRTTVTSTGSMAFARRQHHLTVLADGSVLATGGTDSTTQVQVDLSRRVDAAERWDPATGRWTTLASAARARQYHSAAVLLPDGRVMTGGGGVCGACVEAGYLEKNVEYFSPPYLFDSSGRPAVRPQLSAVPTQVDLGSTFTVTSSSAGQVARLGLVRLGAETHGVDQGQRFVDVPFTVSGSTLTAAAPTTGAQAPPGWYMLFATTRAGTPSVASMVHVGPTWPSGPEPAPGPSSPGPPTSSPTTPGTPATPGGGSTAAPGPPRCLEATAGGRRSAVVRWSCTGAEAQVWRARRADRSLRVLGRCLTFGRSGPVAARDAVLLSPCTGSAAQRVRLRGLTVRPAARPDLCVSSAGTRLRPGARLRLLACDGSARQRWTTRP